MASLSANLKVLMDLAKINASELARRTGIAQPIIHRLSTGQNTNPKLATVKPISEYFMVKVSQLIGEDPLPTDISGQHFSSQHHGWSRVPVISWLDALNWERAVQQELRTDPASNYVLTDVPVSKSAYSLVVRGHTMEPLFANGMTIVVEPEREAQDRDFVVVHLHQDVEARLRQILMDGPDRYIKSLNPDMDQLKMVKLEPEDKVLGVMAQAKVDYLV